MSEKGPCVHLLQVKCLPHDVVPGDSCVVQGLVCRKNVAHRRMKTFRENPRILMLRGALETRRQSTNLSSFDTVLGQARPPLLPLEGTGLAC